MEKKEGGSIKSRTMTRRCLELVLFFLSLTHLHMHIHTDTHFIVGQRFKVDNSCDREMV